MTDLSADAARQRYPFVFVADQRKNCDRCVAVFFVQTFVCFCLFQWKVLYDRLRVKKGEENG